MSFHRVIGIDLGTTSCAVSVWDGSRIVVVPGAGGSPTTPAVVGQNHAGQVVVGQAPARDTGNAVTGIKRMLGERIHFRGRSYPAQEICAFLLIELKRQAEAAIGEAVHDAVITVPASFDEPGRRAVREAAALAQLNVRRLLDDPIAAAVAFGAGDGETYAIYDLGGGSFDVSVVRITAAGVTVLGTAGDSRLGGDDLDERLVDYALRHIRVRHHVDLSRDPSIRRRIRREAEIRKREPAAADATTLELPVLTATVAASVPLTRRAFEAMISPDIERTLDHVAAAIATAEARHGLDRSGIDAILLVGGSTRIPLIRSRLAAYFRRPVEDIRSDLDPDLIVRGAGLVARGYEPSHLVEGVPRGLLSANLRLRAEMADPTRSRIGAPRPPAATGPPGALPGLPAETPADFRPIAQLARDRLTATPADEYAALRTAYLEFVIAIHAAAPDPQLVELGQALAAEYAQTPRPPAIP